MVKVRGTYHSLSLIGCRTTLVCKRRKLVVSIAAFTVGVVSTAAIAVLACWLLISMRQPPSGLVVIVSVVAGMAKTNLILMLASEWSGHSSDAL